MWHDFGHIAVTAIEVGFVGGVAWLAWSIIDDLWATMSEHE